MSSWGTGSSGSLPQVNVACGGNSRCMTATQSNLEAFARENGLSSFSVYRENGSTITPEQLSGLAADTKLVLTAVNKAA